MLLRTLITSVQRSSQLVKWQRYAIVRCRPVNMHSVVNRILTLLVIYSLACFHGTWAFFTLSIKVLFYGTKCLEVKPRPKPPECLNDPQHGTHNYIKLESVKIHYVEAGDKKKPLMLFVHGFPEFWYSWRHQMKEFKKTHWVVAIDMRGYGDSDKPTGKSAYTIRKIVRDIRDVITGLGKTKCILVAHDWGGVIAWRLATLNPELVDKLIIMNSPHPEVFMVHMRSSFKQMLMSWYIFFFQLPFLPEMMLRQSDLNLFDKLFRNQMSNPDAITDEDIEAYKYVFGQPGAFTPPLNYYRNLFTSMLLNKNSSSPTESALQKKIEIPVLIIWGAKDLALHLKLAELSSQRVENCMLKVIPNAGHWVQQDSVDQVNEFMSDFVYEFSKPIRLVRKMQTMRRQLVSSVSGVMRWTGIIGKKQAPQSVKSRNSIATTVGKQLIISTFHVLHRMSGAPLTGLQNIAIVI